MGGAARENEPSRPLAFRPGTGGPHETLAFLERLQSELAVTSSPEQAAELTLALLAERLHLYRATVLLLDPDSQDLMVLAHHGPPSSVGRGARIPSRVLSLPDDFGSGHVQVCNDTANEPSPGPLLKALRAEGVRSFANIPLLADGALLGSLNVAFDRAGGLPAGVIEVATHAARSLSLVLRAGREQTETRNAERRYSNLFRGLPVGLYRTAPSGEIIDANPAFLAMLGHRRLSEVTGRRFDDLFADAEDSRRAHEFLDRVGLLRNFELRIRRHDGHLIWVQNNARAVRDAHGELLHYEGSLQDITERREAEERLLHDAMHDTLTGLPNRAFFMDRLLHALRQSERHPDYLFAVLFIDFDRFKVVNDSLGHQLGDLLLTDAGRRLAGCLRQVDSLARLGGDEFAILLDGIHDVVEAAVVAERVHGALAEPFHVQDNELYLTASIGIAMSGPGYRLPEEILRDADIAMYRAKAAGLGQHVVFDAQMHRAALALLRLETDLRRALSRAEFVLHYQPIISLLDHQKVAGFEALLRWPHPELGLLEPAHFLTRAEESGLILPLGRWVLREACRQLLEWQSELPAESLSVSVNLSRRQFLHPDLVDEVSELLGETGLDPARLRLELTENVIFRESEASSALLHRLKELGVSLDVDDFGVGYSSLSKLSHFPIDALKTDRSLLAGAWSEPVPGPAGSDRDPGPARIAQGARSGEILRAVMSLASSLGMEVVAEGVETPRQLQELIALGCRFAQGNLLGPPMTPADAARFIAGRG